MSDKWDEKARAVVQKTWGVSGWDKGLQFNADDVLAAISAALREAAGEWRTIESAPRDGTRVLAFTAERCSNCVPGTAGMLIVYWLHSDWCAGRHLESGGFVRAHHKPTHWRPIPEAPEPPEEV